jgi:hypothetical protein
MDNYWADSEGIISEEKGEVILWRRQITSALTRLWLMAGNTAATYPSVEAVKKSENLVEEHTKVTALILITS